MYIPHLSQVTTNNNRYETVASCPNAWDGHQRTNWKLFPPTDTGLWDSSISQFHISSISCGTFKSLLIPTGILSSQSLAWDGLFSVSLQGLIKLIGKNI